MSWITPATTVVRPDRRRGAKLPRPRDPRSHRSRHLPGGCETIELVVYATAHRRLRMAQAPRELVDPANVATYSFPQHVEPRLLFGIPLAYRALAYICAALAGAAQVGLIAPKVGEAAVTDLGCRRDDPQEVLPSACSHPTDAGADFALHTHDLADHVVT